MLERFVGNTQFKQDIINNLKAQRLPHCILLTGEKGVGCGFCALLLAADYLYPNGGAGANRVLEGNSEECIIITGEGASGQIKKERIIDMRREIFSSALCTNGRVVIIKDVHNLNVSSANSLLKVLEEPPHGVLFILTTDNPASLLPTITSRASQYTITAVSDNECENYLNSQKYKDIDIKLLSNIYCGKIGSCKRICEDKIRKKTFEDAIKAVFAMSDRDMYALQVLFTNYEKEKEQTLDLLFDIASLLSCSIMGKNIGVKLPDSMKSANILPLIINTTSSIKENMSLKLSLTVLCVNIGEV